MERRPDPSTKTPTATLTALALLGPLFGIATQVWAQALLLLGLGMLFVFAPPRRSPGTVWWLLCMAILAFGFTAFLPARWFAMPEWRRVLTADFRVALPGTLSPQPWVSLHALCLLFAGLAFALYLMAQEWSQHARRLALRSYAGGIVMLALLALGSLATGWRVPFWPKVLNSLNDFGIFPNRNQTANVFALAGILATALAFDAFKRERKGAWFWAVSVVVLGAAIVKTYSRAGILIFFCGIAVWVLVSIALSKSRKAGSLAVAGIALMLTGFFIFGGGTFARFQKLTQDMKPDYRVVIQKDALHLAAAAPWLGQGLGNFAPVFAMAREASADQNRALHPESDWLWVVVEMGWPAALLLALAFLLWLRQCLPLSPGSDRALRAAAMVCGVAFALHSLVDVSGHRPGSAWPALFLAGLALHPKRSAGARFGLVPAPVFRVLGVLLLLVSAWWLASVFSDRVGRTAPTLASVARFTNEIERQNLQSEHDAAAVSAGEALRIMPLDAELHYKRGAARLAASSAWGAAWDFGTARFLEPRWVGLCFDEGKAWVAAGRMALARDAWFEALRRAGDSGPDRYEQMLFLVHDLPGMQALLSGVSRKNPEYFLVYLRHAAPLDCEMRISELLDAEPKLGSFSPAQKRALFATWFRSGDRDLLFAGLVGNPEWQQDGWRVLAKIYAGRMDYRNACKTARDWTAPPAMPAMLATRALPELERAFRTRPDDLDIGLQLHSSQLAEGKTQEALATLHLLEGLPGHPAYLAYLAAEILGNREEWELAWKAWLRFGGAEFQ